MQVRVVQGNELGFNAMVYNQPDQRLLDYLQNSINTASQKLQNTGSYIIDAAKSMYDQYNSSAAINAAKALISTMNSHLNPDVILNLNEENIFNAMPIMQEYIMVQPELWELNRNQSCNGFEGTYYNCDPKVRTYEDHVRYQEVMDGIMQFDDSDDAYFVTYSSSGMDELHFMDQLSIMSTWDAAANLIAQDIDPTSPDGEEL